MTASWAQSRAFSISSMTAGLPGTVAPSTILAANLAGAPAVQLGFLQPGHDDASRGDSAGAGLRRAIRLIVTAICSVRHGVLTFV